VRGVEVLLQHGWAWDASCFSAWQSTVPGAFRLAAADRGYFGSPALSPARPQLVVAHSFGLHLLAPEYLDRARLVVIIGGFRSFHPEEGAASRRSQRLIARMRQRLRREPEDLLRDFYARCFYPEESPFVAPASPDLGLLGQDLEKLDTHTLDLEPLAAVERLLLLHGSRDCIVPLERATRLHRELSASSLQIIEGAGHALPFTHAPQCWEFIRQAWTA